MSQGRVYFVLGNLKFVSADHGFTPSSYIHGGAWRDPAITSASFLPTIGHLLHKLARSTSLVQKSEDPLPVAGFASINYRLSPHPAHPQDPATTPDAKLRDAKHPDHIVDVRAAMAALHRDFPASARYVLVGHSCGATLAWQFVMGDDGLAEGQHRQLIPRAGSTDELVAMPMAVLGVAGLYDLRGIALRHGGQYDGFIEGAFGADRSLWDRVSPAAGSTDWVDRWTAGRAERDKRIACVMWSRHDELVDAEEAQTMRRAIEKHLGQSLDLRLYEVDQRPLKHDELWSDGRDMADALHSILASIALYELAGA